MSNEVEIPFREDMRQAIIYGGKSCTTRTKAYGAVGDCFKVENLVLEITAVDRVLLGYVARHKYKQEGFKDSVSFIEAWEQLHPRKGFVAEQFVWLHEFTVKAVL